jgi:hypothetical protein
MTDSDELQWHRKLPYGEHKQQILHILFHPPRAKQRKRQVWVFLIGGWLPYCNTFLFNVQYFFLQPLVREAAKGGAVCVLVQTREPQLSVPLFFIHAVVVAGNQCVMHDPPLLTVIFCYSACS